MNAMKFDLGLCLYARVFIFEKELVLSSTLWIDKYCFHTSKSNGNFGSIITKQCMSGKKIERIVCMHININIRRNRSYATRHIVANTQHIKEKHGKPITGQTYQNHIKRKHHDMDWCLFVATLCLVRVSLPLNEASWTTFVSISPSVYFFQSAHIIHPVIHITIKCHKMKWVCMKYSHVNGDKRTMQYNGLYICERRLHRMSANIEWLHEEEKKKCGDDNTQYSALKRIFAQAFSYFMA